MKPLAILIITTLFSATAISQNDGIKMSKQQFLEMFKNASVNKDKIAEIRKQSDEQMRSKLPADVYQQMKADEAQIEKETTLALADCMGVSTETLNAVKSKVTPEVMFGFIQQCSSSLPDSIKIGASNWLDVPELSDFNDCTDAIVKKEHGVSMIKMQQCQADFEEGEDW